MFGGVARGEFSIASTSQLSDPRKKKWAVEMLEKLDIPSRLLPEIVPSGTILGPLHDDVAQECGAGKIPVITPASHDTASAVAAVPAEAPDGWCYISSGTWSLLGAQLAEPLVKCNAIEYNYTHDRG